MRQKRKHLRGFPKGFPKGAPFGIYLPINSKTTEVDPGDTDIRFIQSDYFGEDYFGTDWR